jgi:acetate kinase
VFAPDGKAIAEQETEPVDHDEATHVLVTMAVKALGGPQHRVVHGGPDYAEPMLVSDALLRELESFSPLAPLHQPHNLAPMRAIRSRLPDVPQVVCFDTAFHRAQAWEAKTFALPRKLSEDGIRRYGFHGISYDYIGSRLKTLAPDLARGRVIVAHLGNGASLSATSEGRSVASTMGFTAVDGLMMGTCCGALDPGVMIHLIDHYGFDARELEDLVYKESGLLGVSGMCGQFWTITDCIVGRRASK